MITGAGAVALTSALDHQGLLPWDGLRAHPPLQGGAHDRPVRHQLARGCRTVDPPLRWPRSTCTTGGMGPGRRTARRSGACSRRNRYSIPPPRCTMRTDRWLVNERLRVRAASCVVRGSVRLCPKSATTPSNTGRRPTNAGGGEGPRHRRGLFARCGPRRPEVYRPDPFSRRRDRGGEPCVGRRNSGPRRRAARGAAPGMARAIHSLGRYSPPIGVPGP